MECIRKDRLHREISTHTRTQKRERERERKRGFIVPSSPLTLDLFSPKPWRIEPELSVCYNYNAMIFDAVLYTVSFFYLFG